MSEQRRILIADDEAQVRGAFATALTMARGEDGGLAALESELFGKSDAAPAANIVYELTSVAQGEEAVAAVSASLAENKPYGVVFLDMRMPPGIDGTATAKAIRALDPFVNIVLVTGYSDIDVSEVAAQVLPADKLFFIAKPFEVTEIRQQAAALSARWSHETAMVRQLKTRNLELEAARAEAVRANMAKSHFLANVSHELRTPLNAIIGFSDIMANELYGPHSDARYLDYSREINVSGKGLLGSINDIIDTARLDIGKIVLSLEEVDVADVLAAVVRELNGQAVRKSVTLSAQPAPGKMPITGDLRRLQQILFAIVHNAVKFTPNGGQVEVALAAGGGNVVVSVRDSGPGMAADLIEAVQRPFAQGETELARHNGGLGLGLSLAKRLVELHHGQILIDSAVGQGTTVRLTFPAKNAASAAA